MLSFVPRKRHIVTMAEIRREAKEAARHRRDHEGFLSWRFAEQKRLQEIEAAKQAETEKQHQAEAEKQKAIEFECLEHARVLAELCRRLAYVFNRPCGVDQREIYKLMMEHSWTCPKTKVKHSPDSPLSIDFIVPLSQGGRLRISNIVPRFRPGLLAGEFFIERYENPVEPEADGLPRIIQFDGASYAGAA